MPARPQEFERLVAENARIIGAAIRRVCGRRYGSLVPDVEQEVYLALWKRLQVGKEIEHPASYLYKVALTTAIAVVRKLRPEAASLEDLDRPPGATPAAAGELLPEERARLIEQALASAEPDQARALRAYLAGFNHREVAALYGWSESVARHRIYRGLERLRRRLM